MKEEVEKLLKEHNQRGGWSCSASAHEFIAKLHGKIAASDYPLQSDTEAAHKAGFQFEPFFDKHGFTAQDEGLPPAVAVKKFEAETAAKRFPLVSLVGKNAEGKPTAHIVVAVPVEDGVALADPGNKALITNNSDETRALLEKVSKAIPDRPDIHCLFYKEK